MATSYRIDEQQRCIFFKLYEELSDWDLGTGVQAVWADPQFHPQFHRLIDATQVTAVTLHPEMVEAISSDVRSQAKGIKVALVANLGRMYELLSLYRDRLSGMNCRLFLDKQEAL